MRKPIVVVGAGAAGLLAALYAGRGGARTLLLESTRDGGRKILISGGGRCNVLPSELNEQRYVSASSPNTLRKILRSWPLAEQREFFERGLGLPLMREAETGKLFPMTNRARDVRDRLITAATEAGVEVWFDATMVDVRPAGEAGRWRVALRDAEPIEAAAVILATGGLSVPATGSDGGGLRIAGRLGHRLNETYPALTPLTADPPRHAHLAGISLHVRLKAPGAGGFATEGGFLFTHRGYSGPSVLDISHLAVRSRREGADRQPILVQWTELDARAWHEELTTGGSASIGGVVRRRLPARLADSLLLESDIHGEGRLGQLRREERSRLVETLARYPLPWTGDEGYKKAEVTGGGVDLGEIDSRTMESRRHRGLFLCGEMLDAFGPIGGYNFFWAWATGRAAGRGAAAAIHTSRE